MYRRTKVDPVSFEGTKENPLEVGELLLILQCMEEQRSVLRVLEELRSIPWRTKVDPMGFREVESIL